jgi:hypothetical protein
MVIVVMVVGVAVGMLMAVPVLMIVRMVMGDAFREPPREPCPGALGLYLPVPRLRGGHQGYQEFLRCGGNVINGVIEHLLIDLGGFLETRELPHELQGSAANLRFRGGRVEIEKGLDASAHGASPVDSDIPRLRTGGNRFHRTALARYSPYPPS